MKHDLDMNRVWPIYTAINADAAAEALNAFEASKLRRRYPDVE